MKTVNNHPNGITWDNGPSEERIGDFSREPYARSDMDHKWGDIQNEYRIHYPELANEDLSYFPGKFDELTQRIAKKTLRSHQEVKEELEHWTPSLYKRYDH